MKLPSGKEVKLKTPTKEELEKFSLSGVIVSDVIEPLIEIGKCKKCGESHYIYGNWNICHILF